MDTPGYPESNPSLLLLNEIEILLAQTRLMELYLKQAQVSAAHKAVGVHEQHQAELVVLRRALAEKEQVIATQQRVVSVNEKTLAEQIATLQVRIGDQQNLLAGKENQWRQGDAEISGLRQRIVALETAKKQSAAAALRSNETCRDLEAALATLRSELEENRRDLQRQQVLAQELHESARHQLVGLQNQLAERQVWAAAAGNELQRAKDEIVQLHQHIAEIQGERHSLAAAAAREVEQARQGFESELSGLQSALAGRDGDLQNSQRALGEIERKVSADIQALRNQFEEKQELLDLRDGQLRDALAQATALQQRVGELEAVHQQATLEVLESERTRGALESEIASLRREVAVRERALTERQEAVTGVELALHGKIQALQQELARGRSAIQARESEFDQLRGESDSLRARVTASESAANTELAARHALESDRAKLKSELADRHEVLAQTESTARAVEISLRAHQEQSAGEIADLRRQLDEQRITIDQGATDRDQLRTESVRWRERNEQAEADRSQLEQRALQADALRQELAAQLQAKDQELHAALVTAEKQKTTALAEQDSNFQSAADRLRREMGRLREEFNQQQTALSQNAAEVERLRSENAWQREQYNQSEHSRSELERNWRQAEALSQDLETRLHAKDDEIRVAHASAIVQQDAALGEQAARFKAIEEQTASEIAQLNGLIDEHRTSVEQSHDELVRLQADFANLNEQNIHSSARCDELEAQRYDREEALRKVQANANEKDTSYREQETKLRAAVEQLDSELNQSRDQLDQQTRKLEQANHELSQLRTEVFGLREQHRQSESARQELEQNWRQAESRQQEWAAQLEAKENELRSVQSNAHEQQETALRATAQFETSEGELRRELALLRSQLDERQKSTEQNQQALDQLNAEIVNLREQKQQAEQSRFEVEQNWQQAMTLRQEIETRLHTKDDELRVAHADAIEQRDAALSAQAARVSSIEEQHASAIAQLNDLLDQHGKSVEESHNELARLHADITNLHEQSTDWAAQRRELEAQLHAREEALRAEQTNANEKDVTHREQETKLRAVEEQLGAELNQLHERSDQQTQHLEQANHELSQLRTEVFGLREQHRQSESARHELEQNWRLAESRQQEWAAQLEAKENELRSVQSNAHEQQETALRATAQFETSEGELRRELALLRSQLDERQKSTEQNQQALDQLNAEIVDLREQKQQAEQSRLEVEQNWQQAAALRQELETRLHAKEGELQAQRATDEEQHSAALAEQAARFKEQLNNEISDLRHQLAHQQDQAEKAHSELSRLHAEVSGLRERSAGAEMTRAELDRQAALTATLRDELAASLQTKENELQATRATAEAQLDAALREQQQQFAAVEDRLKSEVARLRAELEEQGRIAESGSSEVVHVRSELALVQKQNFLSEQARRELEQNWQQIVALRQELEAHLRAKDDELHATRSSAVEIKGQLDAKLHQLETDLAEKQVLVNRRDADLDHFKAESGRLSTELAAREAAQDELQIKLAKELELSRTAHQAELVALREEAILRQQTLENQLLQRQDEIAGLHEQLRELERRTGHTELEIRTREQNLAAAVAECAALRGRLQEVESRRHSEDKGAREEFDQARKTLDVELKQLRNELQQKIWALAQQQASMENLALAHKQHLQKLEDRLVEQHSAKDRSEELAKAQLETGSLHGRIEALQLDLQHAQVTADRRAEQINQDYAAQIENLSAEVSRQSAALQEHETALVRREQLLRSEIDSLIGEAQEKNQILQNRNDELVRAKSDRDILHDRLKDLELATNQTEAAVSEKSEQMRTEFQAQIALLQAELSQKEWALEEQRASAGGLNQQYREQVEGLNQKLAQAKVGAHQDPDQFVIGAEKLNGGQQERHGKYPEVTDRASQGSNHPSLGLGSRRWRTRLDWKRRWRT